MRAPMPTYCGRCEHRLLEVGDPILVITFRHFKFVRCGQCEGPAPPDLPALIERVPITPTVLLRPARTLIKLLPFDWKARAGGDPREPGQDG